MSNDKTIIADPASALAVETIPATVAPVETMVSDVSLPRILKLAPPSNGYPAIAVEAGVASIVEPGLVEPEVIVPLGAVADADAVAAPVPAVTEAVLVPVALEAIPIPQAVVVDASGAVIDTSVPTLEPAVGLSLLSAPSSITPGEAAVVTAVEPAVAAFVEAAVVEPGMTTTAPDDKEKNEDDDVAVHVTAPSPRSTLAPLPSSLTQSYPAQPPAEAEAEVVGPKADIVKDEYAVGSDSLLITVTEVSEAVKDSTPSVPSGPANGNEDDAASTSATAGSSIVDSYDPDRLLVPDRDDKDKNVDDQEGYALLEGIKIEGMDELDELDDENVSKEGSKEKVDDKMEMETTETVVKLETVEKVTDEKVQKVENAQKVEKQKVKKTNKANKANENSADSEGSDSKASGQKMSVSTLRLSPPWIPPSPPSVPIAQPENKPDTQCEIKSDIQIPTEDNPKIDNTDEAMEVDRPQATPSQTTNGLALGKRSRSQSPSPEERTRKRGLTLETRAVQIKDEQSKGAWHSSTDANGNQAESSLETNGTQSSTAIDPPSPAPATSETAVSETAVTHNDNSSARRWVEHLAYLSEVDPTKFDEEQMRAMLNAGDRLNLHARTVALMSKSSRTFLAMFVRGMKTHSSSLSLSPSSLSPGPPASELEPRDAEFNSAATSSDGNVDDMDALRDDIRILKSTNFHNYREMGRIATALESVASRIEQIQRQA